MDGSSAWPTQQGCSAYSILLGVLITANKCAKIVRSHAKVWLVKVIETMIQSHSGLNSTKRVEKIRNNYDFVSKNNAANYTAFQGGKPLKHKTSFRELITFK